MNEQPEIISETLALETIPPPINAPGDAKDKAVADLTSECYKRASQLTLTKEEITALKADFSDESFQPGAAGKENLIYIEHAALRERLDDVIGMGQWCLIPSRRWAEPFTYQKERWVNNRRSGQYDEVKGTHLYVDCIMLVRGAFVASAIGEMTYYPDNHSQNYGDAVEGAETAALRRCCKRLGVGLQAWRKDWCLGWWDRKKRGNRPTPKAKAEGYIPPATPADDASGTDLAPERPRSDSGVSTPQPTVKTPPSGTQDTAKTRLVALHKLGAAPGEPHRAAITAYCLLRGWIKDMQELEDLPMEHVPKRPSEIRQFGMEMAEFEQSRHQPADLV